MISEGKNTSNWARNHRCGTLAKTVGVFCLCHKNLFKFKLKSNELTCCWWYMTLIPDLGRQRETDLSEFEASQADLRDHDHSDLQSEFQQSQSYYTKKPHLKKQASKQTNKQTNKKEEE